MLFEGLHIPLTTPFHSDGRLHPAKLASNAARYSKTPAAGLIVLGATGEPTLLSDEETREALAAAAAAASPEKVLTAGIARDSVYATLELAEFAATLHYDAMLIGLPSLLSGTSSGEGMLWFRTLADRSPLPIVLLCTTARELAMTDVAELAGHSNIIGMLDAAHDAAQLGVLVQRTAAVKRTVTVTHVFAAVTARMQQAAAAAAQLDASNLISADSLAQSYAGASAVSSIDGGIAATLLSEPPPPLPHAAARKLRTRTVGFQVLCGSTTGMVDALQAGAAGIAPGLAAAAPQACYEVYAAWKDSDLPLAAEKQLRLIGPAQTVEGKGVGAVKFACDLNGYFGGLPRLPLLGPNRADRTQIEHQMHPVHN